MLWYHGVMEIHIHTISCNHCEGLRCGELCRGGLTELKTLGRATEIDI